MRALKATSRWQGSPATAVTAAQCARSPPCAHAGPMARRLALLLLVLAGATAHVPRFHSTRAYTLHSSSSDSESLDPFVVFDDYSDSREPPPPTPPKISAKVILRTKGPVVNTTVKNHKSENKKIVPIVKTTSSSKLKEVQLVTKKPVRNSSWGEWRDRPLVEVSPHFVLMAADLASPDIASADIASPDMSLPTTSPPPTTRQPPTTSRRPKSTRKPSRTTRKPQKPTKKPQKYTKNTTCPPKNTGWFSSFFQDNKLNRVQKKPTKPAWYSGINENNKICGGTVKATPLGGLHESRSFIQKTSTRCFPFVELSFNFIRRISCVILKIKCSCCYVFIY